MDIQGFANMLDGREYGNEITKEEEKQAKELGFVVVFGASDDLAEFRGAIHSETDCCDGGDIYIDKDGLIELCEGECKHYKAAFDKAEIIEAIWSKNGFSWSYATDIPHATFVIREEDEAYCRGIVFELKSLEASI